MNEELYRGTQRKARPDQPGFFVCKINQSPFTGPGIATVRIPRKPDLDADQHWSGDCEQQRNGEERRVEGNHRGLT
ncbi:hypothetical protein ACYZTX_20080 [Pseudomonas sp. MDT1-17]